MLTSRNTLTLLLISLLLYETWGPLAFVDVLGETWVVQCGIFG